MDVLFITSVSVVTADPPQSRKLFMDRLGLPLEKYEADEYYSSDRIAGSKHFGVWPPRGRRGVLPAAARTGWFRRPPSSSR
jgi:hypothetical protein